jgi:ParB family chromosome partitioning protein
MSEKGSVESALLKLGPPPAKKRQGLVGDIQALAQSIMSYSWTSLSDLKGDPEALRSVEEAEKLLRELKKTLSKS